MFCKCGSPVADAGEGAGVVSTVGMGVGLDVGPGVGDEVGLDVGLLVGNEVGLEVGLLVGASTLAIFVRSTVPESPPYKELPHVTAVLSCLRATHAPAHIAHATLVRSTPEADPPRPEAEP